MWDTNFPIEQGFAATFAYAIGVRATADESGTELALRTAAELVHPLRATRATGAHVAAQAQRQVLSISDPRVQLVGLVQSDDGATIVRVQSFADEPTRVAISFDRNLARAVSPTFLGDERGDLEFDGGAVYLPLEHFEAAAAKVSALPSEMTRSEE